MNKKIYIEAGANNGIEQSRSLWLKGKEEYFGILIEPDLEAYLDCVSRRQDKNTEIINCALVDFEFKRSVIKLNKHNMSLMNSVFAHDREKYDGIIECPARTLQSILDWRKITEVEFFFLDVEGFEHQVLRGIDFQKTRFLNIEVESHYPFLNVSFEEDKKRFVDFMSEKGYYLEEVLEGDGLPKLIFKPK